LGGLQAFNSPEGLSKAFFEHSNYGACRQTTTTLNLMPVAQATNKPLLEALGFNQQAQDLLRNFHSYSTTARPVQHQQNRN
jgi:hypothetical protein